jgi:hypothetical protein
MGDFGRSDYCASLRGPGRDSLQRNNYNNFPFWVLKGSPEGGSKICLKKGKNIGYLKDPWGILEGAIIVLP